MQLDEYRAAEREVEVAIKSLMDEVGFSRYGEVCLESDGDNANVRQSISLAEEVVHKLADAYRLMQYAKAPIAVAGKIELDGHHFSLQGTKLHCGELIEVMIGGDWELTTIEYDNLGRVYYLADFPDIELNGLEARKR